MKTHPSKEHPSPKKFLSVSIIMSSARSHPAKTAAFKLAGILDWRATRVRQRDIIVSFVRHSHTCNEHYSTWLFAGFWLISTANKSSAWTCPRRAILKLTRLLGHDVLTGSLSVIETNDKYPRTKELQAVLNERRRRACQRGYYEQVITPCVFLHFFSNFEQNLQLSDLSTTATLHYTTRWNLPPCNLEFRLPVQIKFTRLLMP